MRQALLLLFVAATSAQTPVCITGYVMDTFCINRGSLLDSGLASLDNPHRHSIHCLIDVSSCRNGGYEMLAPALDTGCEENPVAPGCTPYKRVLRLDAQGTRLVLETAAQVGHPSLGCTDCCSTCGGTQREGFRATVVGTYNLDDLLPRRVKVTAVHPDSVTCASLNVSVASSEGDLADTGGLRRLYRAHGSCMLVGWGFLLPMGVTIARTMRHRDPLWLKLHRFCNVLGLLVATVGFIIALLNFKILGEEGTTRKQLAHACMGLVVMVLGLQQPFNFLIHPKKPPAGEAPTTARRAWELWHKGSGYTAVLLSVPTIGIGTILIATPGEPDGNAFRAAYGASWVAILCVGTYLYFFDKASAARAIKVDGSTRHDAPPDKGAVGQDRGAEMAEASHGV